MKSRSVIWPPVHQTHPSNIVCVLGRRIWAWQQRQFLENAERIRRLFPYGYPVYVSFKRAGLMRMIATVEFHPFR